MNDFLDELDQELDEQWVSDKLTKKTEKAGKTDKKKTVAKPEKQKQWEKRFERRNSSAPKKQITKSKHSDNQNFGSLKERLMSNLPQTKFYLPTLREGYTRMIPIGWNDEIGSKNMDMLQYWENIVLIDCGIQFAEPEMYGADFSIPDISFLAKYTDKISGMLITHGHLDHIWSLKVVLPALNFPPLYATKLTIGLIKKQLEEHKILDKATLIEVDAGSEKEIHVGPFKVEYFKVNHSIPDCAGLYITSPSWATFMHTWDFKIDMEPEIDEPANLSRIWAFWKKGVTLLMSDSTASLRKGHSMSEKNVGEALEKIVEWHTKGRLIIAAFSSWISRVQQLIDIAARHDKHIFLSGRSMVENIAIAKELGYLKMKPGIVKKMTPKNTEGIPPHKQIIITTWSQWEQFSALSRMAEWKHNSIEIVQWDTVVFSCSFIPGNEKSVSLVMNKLIKLGASIVTKDDADVHTWGHAFQEEQKMMLKLANPKYFCPIFWDLYFRNAHKNTAMSIGIKEEQILLLDNGNIVDFAPDWSVFKSRLKVPIQEIIVDGHGMGTTASHVLKARETMMNAWVLVIAYRIDKRTKAILWHIKIESRGLVYLEEVRFVHRMIIKKAKDIYDNTIKDVPDIEEKDLLKLIRSDLEWFIYNRINREPMIIPIITEI